MVVHALELLVDDSKEGEMTTIARLSLNCSMGLELRDLLAW